MALSFSAQARDNENIEALPTRYRGWKFRSRSEARWAVFFDEVGLDFEYEPEGFRIYHEDRIHYYLPDFIVEPISSPDYKEGPMWVEIKGRMKEKDRQKVHALACQSGYPVLVIQGIPSNHDAHLIESNGNVIKPIYMRLWGNKLILQPDSVGNRKRFLDAAHKSRGHRFDT